MKKNNPFKPLDKYEAKLIKAIENDEFVPVSKEEQERIMSYFVRKPRKGKRVTIRVSEKDLTHIQERAIANGMSYQTLINLILHHFVQGKMILKV